jgi:DnaJ-class molecular chaperone
LFEAIFGGVGGSPHIVIHNFTQTMNESPISEQFDINMVIGVNLCDAYNGITQYEHINYYESEKNGSQTEKIIITIPPSMPDGYMLQIKNKGNVIPKSGGRRGCLNLEFNIQTHDVFKREGDDLLIEHKVSLKDALCGFTFDMLHLNGRSYKMSCKPCSITNNEIKLLPGLGYNSNGTLKIKFLVELPTELSKEQIVQLSNIL